MVKSTNFLMAKKAMSIFVLSMFIVFSQAKAAAAGFVPRDEAEIPAVDGRTPDVVNDCPICLSSLGEGEVIWFTGTRRSDPMPGCHQFHKNCLKQAHVVAASLVPCPMCRNPHAGHAQHVIEQLERTFCQQGWFRKLFF